MVSFYIGTYYSKTDEGVNWICSEINNFSKYKQYKSQKTAIN